MVHVLFYVLVCSDLRLSRDKSARLPGRGRVCLDTSPLIRPSYQKTPLQNPDIVARRKAKMLSVSTIESKLDTSFSRTLRNVLTLTRSIYFGILERTRNFLAARSTLYRPRRRLSIIKYSFFTIHTRATISHSILLTRIGKSTKATTITPQSYQIKTA